MELDTVKHPDLFMRDLVKGPAKADLFTAIYLCGFTIM